jgi:hypothetical protein
MRLILILWAALASVAVVPGTAAAAEQVDIPQPDTPLHGILFRPEGAGPFPGVVALQGCESLVGRAGKMAPHLADWGGGQSAESF